MRGADVVEWGPLRFERQLVRGTVKMTLLVEDEHTRDCYVHVGDSGYFEGLYRSLEAVFPELVRREEGNA